MPSFQLYDSMDSSTIEVRVKMAKVRHKNILTVRYFFIEILDQNNHVDHADNSLFSP